MKLYEVKKLYFFIHKI